MYLYFNYTFEIYKPLALGYVVFVGYFNVLFFVPFPFLREKKQLLTWLLDSFCSINGEAVHMVHIARAL